MCRISLYSKQKSDKFNWLIYKLFYPDLKYLKEFKSSWTFIEKIIKLKVLSKIKIRNWEIMQNKSGKICNDYP